MDEFLARAQHDEEISQVRLFDFEEVQGLLVSDEISGWSCGAVKSVLVEKSLCSNQFNLKQSLYYIVFSLHLIFIRQTLNFFNTFTS